MVDEYGELKGSSRSKTSSRRSSASSRPARRCAPAAITRRPTAAISSKAARSLRELNRKLGFDFPLDGPKTVNGLMLEHLQDIPEPGTSVKIAEHPIEIVQTQDRMVKAVRIYPARARRKA